jgi:hypothetical protein
LPFLYFLGLRPIPTGYGGLVNLLTREEKEHIIKTRIGVDLGGPLGKLPYVCRMLLGWSLSTSS